jgi:hypothetical protein
MATVTLQFFEKTHLTLGITSSQSGNNINPGSAIATWTVDNPAIVALSPAPSGLTCECRAKAPGTCTVTATLRPPGAQGGAAITGTITVTVLGGVPDTLTISASNPLRQ